MPFDTDVFIIGGGPAGLAAAIAARRRDFRVTVADALRPPIDKACGEGLMPDALTAAARLGVDIPAGAGYVFRGIRLVGPQDSVDGLFPEGEGLGIRRTVLHPILVEQASRAGVEMLWGEPVTGIAGDIVSLGARRFKASWIVGADSGRSLVRHWAALDGVRRGARRFGFRRHYHVAPWSDRVEIHWGDDCQFYVTPVSTREVCLVLMSRDQYLRIDDALPGFPRLRERLAQAPATTPERGQMASTCRLRSVARGNVALVGDASGTVDAITGEGLCLAFQQAAALADAIEAGDLGRYEAAHRRLARRPVFMADFMLTLDRRPRLQKRALAALASRPRLFTDLLATHVGKLSLPGLVKTGIALGWGIATA
jgi:flavin-dependent dehydrogenase